MNELSLCYSKPADNWNEALPVGNGSLGAMVYGTTEFEQLQLNEESIWSREFINRNNPDAYTAYCSIRKLILEGQIKEAEELAAEKLSGIPESQSVYQMLGQLKICMNHINTREYYRWLDLTESIHYVEYRHEQVKYSRECFCSYPDQLLLLRFTSSIPGKQSFRIHLSRDPDIKKIIPLSPHIMMISGKGDSDKSIEFSAAIGIRTKGGSFQQDEDGLIVTDCDCVELMISSSTSYRTPCYVDKCVERINKAMKYCFEELKRRHIDDYQSLFNQFDFRLLQPDRNRAVNKDTDRRIREYDGTDLHLPPLYFQYARYLLISSSRKGTLPANLQGIWNDKMQPPWGSKFTININTQMNYWIAETTGLSECHLPLLEHIKVMKKNGFQTAREMYHCRGFTAHHNTDIWGDTAPQDIWIPATYWPMGAAWLCLHIWEHYLFTEDNDFLREYFPLMEQAALFFIDYLYPMKNGSLVTLPSVSPENTYISEQGDGRLTAGPAMDSQILRELFESCISAEKELQIQSEICKSIRQTLPKLPEISIGKHGQIREWIRDYDEKEPGHRHISQLFALYPGHQIDPDITPDLAEAAKKTLIRRLTHGGGHTGWSRAWIICLWARLRNNEECGNHLTHLISDSTLPNMLDNHPPFQIDGNFGGAAGIAEMLVQSIPGRIILLPALPDSWKNGCIKGFRIRGGGVLDLSWQDGILSESEFRPLKTEKYYFLYNGKLKSAICKSSESYRVDKLF